MRLPKPAATSLFLHILRKTSVGLDNSLDANLMREYVSMRICHLSESSCGIQSSSKCTVLF